MSASIYLYSEFDGPLRIEPGEDDVSPCVWIRSSKGTPVSVALTLDAADRAKLRAALDELDAREAQQAEPAREAA